MGGKGSGGRNRKPTARKQVEGNPGHRRLNKREPSAELGAPDMPRYLDKLAKEEWNRLVPILLTMKTLHRSDGGALAGLCCAHSQFVKAQRDIARRGINLNIYELVDVGKKTPKPVLIATKKNPSLGVASDADRRLRSYFAMFGLDPASRSRLIAGGGSEPPEDPLDEFLEGSAKDTIQ